MNITEFLQLRHHSATASAVEMEQFELFKNLAYGVVTVCSLVVLGFVSFKLSLKNKTVTVRLSEFSEIVTLVTDWFGAYELMPAAKKIRTNMKCHQVADSLISTNSGFRDYGGFLNLGMLLLIIANSRVALENVLKYGILINPSLVLQTLLGNNGWPSMLLIAGLVLYPSVTYCTECLVAHNYISERTNQCVVLINGFLNIVIPAYLVKSEDPHPVFSMFLLCLYIVIFLKLMSYSMVCYWCRNGYPTEEAVSVSADNSPATGNDEASADSSQRPASTGGATSSRANRMKHLRQRQVIRQRTQTLPALDGIENCSFSTKDTTSLSATRDEGEDSIDEEEDEEEYRDPLENYIHEHVVEYPNNVNRRDFLYFLVAPTLCYELNFPRSSRIRKRFLIKRMMEAVSLVGFIIAAVQQWIMPTVEHSLIPFIRMEYGLVLERLLKLAVPNCFIWLLMFYLLFHSFLNILGEILMFGDRNFYQDWWNATTITQFWKHWNIPVHKWATRHVYKPMRRRGFSQLWTSATVFLLSAFFHEYLVSVPLGLFTFWAAGGMLAQVPLMFLLDGTGIFSERIANMIVWATIIFGQPMAILAYYHDYYLLQKYNATIPLLYQFQKLEIF